MEHRAQSFMDVIGDCYSGRVMLTQQKSPTTSMKLCTPCSDLICFNVKIFIMYCLASYHSTHINLVQNVIQNLYCYLIAISNICALPKFCQLNKGVKVTTQIIKISSAISVCKLC